MKRRVLMLIAALALAGVISGVARADSIGPNCNTCQGSIYTLQYALESTSGNLSTYDIIFTIDTSGYNGGGTLLDDVAFKVSAHDPTNVSLDAAPNGALNWTIMPGGINAGGCDGHGSGFVCAFANSLSFAAQVPDGTYQWVFDITVPTGSLFLGSMESSIKARYTNDDGRKVGALVSEDITLQPAVPEPGTLLLVGTGFLGLARAIRRLVAA
jgi:hypothetical protein